MTFSCWGSCLRYAAALPLVVLLAVCCDPAYAGQPLYEITDLAPLCVVPLDVTPPLTGAGINQRGDITGDLICTASGEVYIYDSATDQVRFPVAVGATAFAINNKQEIAGGHFRGLFFPFIVSGDQLTPIGSLTSNGAAYDLNDKGVAVGEISGRAFKWKSGNLTDLDYHLGAKGSTAWAINDRNEITGVSNVFGAVLLSPSGKVTQLGTLGGSTTMPQAINIYAEITGCSERADGTNHAFLWREHRLHDLGPSEISSCGLGINSEGVVVGCTIPPEGGCGKAISITELPASRALLWNTEDVYDLNRLIDRRDPLYGTIVLYSATGINDAGQIVANGCFTAGPSKGRCTAVRLDPVREVAHR